MAKVPKRKPAAPAPKGDIESKLIKSLGQAVAIERGELAPSRSYVLERPPVTPEPKRPVVKHVGMSLRVEFDLIAPTEDDEATAFDDVQAAVYNIVRNEVVGEKSRHTVRVTVQGGIIETAT